MRKTFAYAKTKAQISWAVTAQLISSTDRTVSPIPISKSLSFKPSSEILQTGLCQTWSENPKTGFLTSRLNYDTCKCKVLPGYKHV